MRTKAFIYNSIATALLQIVAMISGFIIPKLLITSYGSEVNGLVTSINQFLNYFNLIEAGLASAAIYALYKPLADKNFYEVNSILVATRNFYYKLGVFYIGLVILLSFVYPLIITSSILSNVEISKLVIVLGCSGAINFILMAKYRVLLTASQKVYIISLASICHIVLNTIIIAVLAYFKVDIIILKTVALFSVFLRSLILYVYIKIHFKFVNHKGDPNISALSKRWDALYLQILGSIQTGAPIVIATLFTSLKLVSVYTIYNMVFAGISGILSIFTSGLSSSFGDVIARREESILKKAYSEFEFTYYMIITWAYSCTLILIMPFINVYTTGINDIEYYFPILGLLFTIDGLFNNLKTPQGMMVISAGMFKETRIQSTIQGLILISSSVVLVNYFGLAGILIGSILSNLYRTIDLLFFIPRILTKLSVKSTLIRIIRIFIIIGLCYLPFMHINISPSSLYNWFIYSIIVACYCLIVTVTLNYFFEKKIFLDVLSRILIQVKIKLNK